MQENVCEYWLIIRVCWLTLCVHLTGLRDVLSPFLTGQKAEEGQILSPSSWARMFIFSCSWTSQLLVLRPSNTNCTISSAFLVLQFADNRLWDFLGSMTTWVNSNNRSLYVSLYILLVLCLWCTLTKIVFLPLYFYSSKQKTPPSTNLSPDGSPLFFSVLM